MAISNMLFQTVRMFMLKITIEIQTPDKIFLPAPNRWFPLFVETKNLTLLLKRTGIANIEVGMFFHKAANIDGILKFIRPKLEVTLNSSKYGIDVDIKTFPHPVNRAKQIFVGDLQAHCRFWERTGFIVDNLPLRFVTSDFLHEYFKTALTSEPQPK